MSLFVCVCVCVCVREQAQEIECFLGESIAEGARLSLKAALELTVSNSASRSSGGLFSWGHLMLCYRELASLLLRARNFEGAHSAQMK